MLKTMKPAEPACIAIPPDIAAKCDGPDQLEKFDRLFRGMIAVPKEALVKEEAEWKRAREKKRR
jgi:hypothetical protein